MLPLHNNYIEKYHLWGKRLSVHLDHQTLSCIRNKHSSITRTVCF
uniref:Uncharacterized protein n=1 Tax=Anguilla anguilla TaxID=7936 RepID=A0A0E9WWI2_ANGAN